MKEVKSTSRGKIGILMGEVVEFELTESNEGHEIPPSNTCPNPMKGVKFLRTETQMAVKKNPFSLGYFNNLH